MFLSLNWSKSIFTKHAAFRFDGDGLDGSEDTLYLFSNVPNFFKFKFLILDVVESNDNDVIYLYTKKVESIGKLLTN